MLLVVKVGLAFCALVLAVVSIGFEALDRSRPGRWFRRLRPPGVVAVAAAIGVFGFGVANEVLSERAKDSSERRLNTQIHDLQSDLSVAAVNLEDVRAQLASAGELLVTSAATNQQLKMAQDAMGGVLVEVGNTELHVYQLDDGLIGTVHGAIRAGDVVEWTLNCHNGTPLPADYGGENYGHLLAESMNPIPVTGTAGRSSASANAQVGASLVYQLPWGPEGDLLQGAMRRSLCVLQVRIYRQARYVLEDAVRQQASDDEWRDHSQRVED